MSDADSQSINLRLTWTNYDRPSLSCDMMRSGSIFSHLYNHTSINDCARSQNSVSRSPRLGAREEQEPDRIRNPRTRLRSADSTEQPAERWTRPIYFRPTAAAQSYMLSVNVHCIVKAMYILWDHIKHDNWVQRNGTLCIIILNDEWETARSALHIMPSTVVLKSIVFHTWPNLK